MEDNVNINYAPTRLFSLGMAYLSSKRKVKNKKGFALLRLVLYMR